MTYQVRWRPAARRAIEQSLPESVAAAAVEFVLGVLAEQPPRVGKQLLPPQEHLHSARRGEYRVPYQVDDEALVVTIEYIRHRRDAYHV